MKLGLFCPTLTLLVGVSGMFLVFVGSPADAALPPVSGGSSNAAVAQLVSDAQKAINAGKLPLAIIDLKNASSAEPRNGPIRSQLGTLLMQTGDYYAAERELRQARKDGASDQQVLPSLLTAMLARHEEKLLLEEFAEPSAPSNMAADILKARALAFQGLGQSAEAIDAMDKSLKLRRDEAGPIVRARIARGAGALPSAMQFTEEAIAVAPNNAGGYLFKISLLLDSNDLNGALALADQLVAKFPANLPAQFSRVEVLMRLQKNDQAKAAVDAALAKNPDNAIGLYYRALLISRTGNYKDAWRIAQSLPQEFLSAEPQAALAVSQMADASGSSETAAAILNAAIKRSPDNEQLRLRLAQMRVKQNDMNGAIDAVEPLGDKLSPTATQTLAALYVRTSRASRALGLLEKLIQSGKGTDATTLQLVALESQMGQPEQALKDLAAAVHQKPTDPVLAERLVLALVSRGRFADALSVSDGLGSDPAQRVRSLALRGQVFVGEHKLDDALASYAKAMQVDPKSQMARYGHANTLELMGKFDEASTDIRSILESEPQSMVAYLRLAEIAARQNRDGQVRGILSQAIKLSPRDPSPRISLVRYLDSRNDRAGALKAANELLKVRPDYAEGMVMLGSLQLATGKKAEAVATYRRLVNLAPQSAQSQVLLGNALLANGDRAGANAALKTAVSMAADSQEVRLAQINALFAENDANGAMASAQAYQNSNPGIEADILLGDTFIRAGRREQAMAIYKKSFAASPSSSTLSRIASTSIAGGDTKSAAEALSGWIAKNPNDLPVRLEYGILLMQIGNSSDAIMQYREILKKSPDNVTSLNNLAWLVRDQDPTDAITLATRAATLSPNSANVLDTLGMIKLKHGKVGDSLPLFKRAHDLSPQNGEISYHLVLSLDATGSHDAAKGFLKALLTSQVKFQDLAEANKLAQTWH